MQIATSSWHYRFLRFTDSTIPHNLCCYFWMVVIKLVVAAAIIVCGVLLVPIWLPGLIIICVVACVGERLQLTYRRWVYSRPKERRPSLVMAWLRAKKDKVCPVLEFVDE